MSTIRPQVPSTPASRFAIEVVERLRNAGFEALWAGGCVRDLVMGNTPEDYDVATSATPDQVRNLFGFRNTLAVGAAFGVIVVLDRQGSADPVEVATFRTDANYSDGRRPDAVTFSTAREDALRRDFTINGMFFDPLAHKIIDYVDGLGDLERRVVRAIGLADARIAEDKLRMLRAVRFAARFGFELESLTLAAITRHAASLSIVSGERIAVEVQKTLKTRAPAWAVDTWAQSGLMEMLVSELDWPAVRVPALQLLDASLTCGNDWRTRLAALLFAGIEPLQQLAVLESLRMRLKWSTEDYHAMRFALQHQMLLQTAHKQSWSLVQPLLVHTDLPVALELLAARSHIDAQWQSVVQWIRERLSWPRERLDPPPLLTGADLIAYGHQPGPAFRLLLTQARARQLDGHLLDKAAAVEWLHLQSV